MSGEWWQYLAVFMGATALAYSLTPIASWLAIKIDILDIPGAHKSHARAVPYLGGLAVAVAFSAAMAVPVVRIEDSRTSHEFLIVMGMALLLSALGLLDDLKNISSLFRFGCEVASALTLWAMHLGVKSSGIPLVDAVTTIIWVVGITNAFNLLDNMDGLSAGIAAIASLSFFGIASLNGQFLVAALSLALAGCALGFLGHNFHPASIYMGDSGALFLGFLISFVGLKLQLSISSDISLFVPVIVCSVAVLDTTLVTASRLRHGLSPFQGGRDHLSHRLVRIGLPVPVAVLVLYAAATSTGVVALVVSRTDATSAWILIALVVAILGGFGALLYNVPVYPNSRQQLVRFTRDSRGDTSTESS